MSRDVPILIAVEAILSRCDNNEMLNLGSADKTGRQPLRATSGQNVLRFALPAVLLASSVLLPYLDKAFNIDDTLFLLSAEQVIKDPLHPTAFTVVWDTDIPVRAASGIFVSGPVTAILLVPTLLLGGVEWVAHAMQLAVLSCGLIATVALAIRLEYDYTEAMLTGAFVAATPAVLGMASTAMPDVPTMALGVCGIERLLAWRQDRRPMNAILGSVILACAMLTRAYAVLLTVPAALLLLNANRKTSGALRYWWAPLVVAPAIAGCILWLMQDPTAEVSDHTRFFRSLLKLWPARSNVIAFGMNWVFAVPIAIPWLIARFRKVEWRVAAFVVPLILLVRPSDAPWWTIPISSVGFLVVIDILTDGARKRNLCQLALGAWLLLPSAMISYFHLPPKYHVPCAPAAALLVVGALRNLSPMLRRAVVPLMLAAGTTLGILIIRADSTLAGIGRSAAQEIIEPLLRNGDRVWIAGHWGFQWYAEKLGARSLTRTPPAPRPGDIIVASTIDDCQVLFSHPKRVLVNSRVWSEPGGRVMSRNAQAGFYSNMWGYLPWSWSRSAINRIDMWQVIP